MNPTHIHIENFRGIELLDLDCKPHSLLLGWNRSGKTSVLDALRAVFQDRVRDQHGDTIAVADLIRTGARSARVVVSFTAAASRQWVFSAA